jgi:hypothetical protein
MSHDVDIELSECDVSLSFTAPGRLVYLFFYEKGTLVREDVAPEPVEKALMPMFTREDWEALTTIVRENLTLAVGGPDTAAPLPLPAPAAGAPRPSGAPSALPASPAAPVRPSGTAR